MKIFTVFLGLSFACAFSLQSMEIAFKQIIYEENIVGVRTFINQFPEYINKPAMKDDGNYPLHHAIITKSLPITKLLIENGADITVKTYYFKKSILKLAAFHSPEIFEYLNTLPNIDLIWSPKILFSASDSLTVRSLIKKGVNVNLLNKNGDTKLHLELRKNSPKVALITTLLELGASPNIANRESQMPIEYIAFLEGESRVLIPTLLANCSLKTLTLIYLAKRSNEHPIENLKDHLPLDLYALLQRLALASKESINPTIL